MPAYAATGTKCSIKVGIAFQDIGQIGQISGPNIQADTVEVTDIDATWKRYVPGHLDGGEMTLEVFIDPANPQHNELRSALINRARREFQIRWTQTDPDQTLTFFGYVTGLEYSASAGEALTATITIKLDGEATWASGA